MSAALLLRSRGSNLHLRRLRTATPCKTMRSPQYGKRAQLSLQLAACRKDKTSTLYSLTVAQGLAYAQGVVYTEVRSSVCERYDFNFLYILNTHSYKQTLTYTGTGGIQKNNFSMLRRLKKYQSTKKSYKDCRPASLNQTFSYGASQQAVALTWFANLFSNSSWPDFYKLTLISTGEFFTASWASAVSTLQTRFFSFRGKLIKTRTRTGEGQLIAHLSRKSAEREYYKSVI